MCAVVLDSGSLAKLYGAKTTPHMFVVSPAGMVVYAGAIDDNRSANLEDVKIAKNFVKTTLDESLVGKPVSISSTQPYGCSVKYQ